jgi:SPP1 gp7 family putative phage head morphogenesis protein
MKFLPEVKILKKDEELGAQKILNVFKKYIFERLQQAITYIQNRSRLDLRSAILKGLVVYKDGFLKPVKTLPISVVKELRSLGAIKSKQGYKVPLNENIAQSILQTQEEAEGKRQSLLRAIQNIENELNYYQQTGRLPAELEKLFDRESFGINTLLDNADSQLQKIPNINPLQNKELQEGVFAEYITKTQLSIIDFTQKEVENIRQDIINAFNQGDRHETVIQKILDKHEDISKNKAMFIARNEMGNVVAEYTKNSYTSVGVEYYMWVTSGDQRVRSWHDYLNGKIFAYKEPPIINEETKERGNPKQDYNCRCRAKPIVLLAGEWLLQKTGAEGIVYYELKKK